MERFSPSTTVSVKASPICIFTSCLAIEMMASGASFGPDSATKMKQPSSICRKHFDLLLPGSGPPDCKMYRNIRNGNNARWQSGIHTPSPMAPAFFTHLLTYCLKYTMRTMQSCLIEIYQDGEHSENGNSKNTSGSTGNGIAVREIRWYTVEVREGEQAWHSPSKSPYGR